MSFFIQSKLGDLVMDIQGAKNAPGTLLDAFTKKTTAPANANQLWEFVSGPVDGYHFIKNPATSLVVDIEGAKTARGTGLDAYTKKTSFPANCNQLWAFYPAPASGYYFIVSLLDGSVIDVEGAKTAPGTLLDAFTKNGNDNQLWTFVDTNGKSVTPPAAPTTVPEPAGGYSGAGNYVLASGSKCATLTGVKATIYVTEDLVWQSSMGTPAFSIQLNAETNSNQPLDWLQFMTHMGDDQGLWPWINIWTPSTIITDDEFWDQAVSNPVAKMPQAARIPAGYSLVVALQNDSAGNVTGASWNVFNSSGSSIGSVSYSLSTTQGGGVPPGDLCPIASFQVTLGGAANLSHAIFSSGAGLIVFEADQAMNVNLDTAYPGCIGYTGGTGETSNVTYGPMSAAPSKVFAQAFNVAADSPQARVIKPNARKAPLPPRG